MNALSAWFRRYFSDPQVVFLSVALVVGFGVVLTMGDMLTPVLASIVIAYLLEGLVGVFVRLGWPRLAGVLLVYIAFMLFVVLVLFWVMPLVSRQITDLIQQLPNMIAKGQQVLMQLPERYPDLVTATEIQALIELIRTEIAGWGQRALTWSLGSVVGLITAAVYLVLMPLLVSGWTVVGVRDVINKTCLPDAAAVEGGGKVSGYLLFSADHGDKGPATFTIPVYDAAGGAVGEFTFEFTL